MSRKKNLYVPSGSQTKVCTPKGDFTIDTEDIPKINNYFWNIGTKGYPETRVKGKRLYIHWALGYEKETCDHINRDKTDNRKANLRKFEYKYQNLANQAPRKNNSSGYQGVYKQGKGYIARIGFKGKRYNLGVFDTPEEAARTRDKKAKELLGEFAYLNFPESEEY